jgi:hypothetical protein
MFQSLEFCDASVIETFRARTYMHVSMKVGSQALNKFMKHDLTTCDSRLVQSFPNAQVKQGNAIAEHVAIRLTEQWLNVHEKEGVLM